MLTPHSVTWTVPCFCCKRYRALYWKPSCLWAPAAPCTRKRCYQDKKEQSSCHVNPKRSWSSADGSWGQERLKWISFQYDHRPNILSPCPSSIKHCNHWQPERVVVRINAVRTYKAKIQIKLLQLLCAYIKKIRRFLYITLHIPSESTKNYCIFLGFCNGQKTSMYSFGGSCEIPLEVVVK